LEIEYDSSRADLINAVTGGGLMVKTHGLTHISHFGFRLVEAVDIDLSISEVERAGGKVLRHGEFAKGYPYAYVTDLDGYEIEIWFE
jgi:predicted enzyme related to lactoylglutathione lyase